MSEYAARPRLSVVVLVRDMAEPLRLTLASIRDIADEIVVIDTGSLDKSREVAREFGARVTDFAWSDDFSAARNFGAQRATGDWLLWLDAGERILDEDAARLRDFVTTQADIGKAYLLLVGIPPAQPSAAGEQVARVRLVPRLPEIAFRGRVAETMTESLLEAGMEMDALPLTIRRDVREHDPRVKRLRAQRNLRLAELETQYSQASARVWNCLGEALQVLGETERSRACFQRALEISDRGSVEMLEAYYGALTSYGNTNADRDQQLNLCISALEVFPVDAQLLCALGGYLQALGKTALGAQAFLTAYKYGQVTPNVWHVPDIREIAASCHSLALQLEKRAPEAIEFLEEVLAENRDSLKLRRRLIEILIQQGERDAALAHVGALPKHTPHKEAFRSAVRGACFAVQQNWIAAKAYLNAGYAHGCRDPICLKWLSICLIASGEKSQARPMLEEWKAAEPMNVEPQKLLEALKEPTAIAKPFSQLRIDSANSSNSPSAIPLSINSPTRAPTRS